MSIRLRKFTTGAGHFTLTTLLIVTLLGGLKNVWSTELAFVSISLLALGLTLTRVHEYLNSLEDRMTLRLLFIPMVANIILAGLTFVLTREPLILSAAGISILGWLALLLAVRRALSNYIPFGRGFLPKDVWLNPPVEVLQPGDAILVHGPMADFVREAVGHTETLVQTPDGHLFTFSFMIESGHAWNAAEDLVRSYIKGKWDFIVLRLKTPLTREQVQQAYVEATEMIKANLHWKDAARARLRKWVAGLPVPQSWRDWLLARYWPTGYDHFGKYWGNRRPGRWTCIGANIELMTRIGVPMRPYGTGAFGICGEFNPILPIRILRDPCYRWLTVEDQAAFVKKSA